MLYISLDFSFSPLILPPSIGIDHLENVSMRYRYPKVLGYRVLGIDIHPALVRNRCETANYCKLQTPFTKQGDLTRVHELDTIRN